MWLASYPKSGNTWLRVFLYHFVRIQGGRPREEDELNKYDRVSQWEANFYWVFERYLGKPLAQATPMEVMSLRARVQAAIARSVPVITMLKTHNVYGEIGGMPTVNSAVSIGGV